MSGRVDETGLCVLWKKRVMVVVISCRLEAIECKFD